MANATAVEGTFNEGKIREPKVALPGHQSFLWDCGETEVCSYCNPTLISPKKIWWMEMTGEREQKYLHGLFTDKMW